MLNPGNKIIMKNLLPFIIIFLFFTTSLFAQQPPKPLVEKNLQGRWEDSTGAIIKFDCIRGDTVIGYGLLDKKENEMGWYVTFKVEWNATYDKSLKQNRPNGYYFLKEVASSEDVLGRTHVLIEIRIEQISATRLYLHTVIGSPPHKLLVYSRVE
jgi:hypothetical protein